jgi:hypothetical protein
MTSAANDEPRRSARTRHDATTKTYARLIKDVYIRSGCDVLVPAVGRRCVVAGHRRGACAQCVCRDCPTRDGTIDVNASFMTPRWLVCLLVVSCAWRVAATEPNAATRRWWSHVQVLAGDDMEGREAGSAGHRKAAAYVASQFRLAGLVAATDEGYLIDRVLRVHG